MDDVIQFQAQVSGNKRSFSLRRKDITAARVSLFSTFSARLVEVQGIGLLSNVDTDIFKEGQVYQLSQRDPSEAALRADCWVPVGSVREMSPVTRLQVLSRDVLIVRRADRVHCLDAVCYHLGGPLDAADIEEFPGGCAIVCPWHRYKISLQTGARLTRDYTEKTRHAQRIHQCKVDEASGQVLVKLNVEGKFASDHYAYMGLGLREPQSKPQSK